MACLRVGELQTVWPTAARKVSMQPQRFGDLSFGITLVSVNTQNSNNFPKYIF